MPDPDALGGLDAERIREFAEFTRRTLKEHEITPEDLEGLLSPHPGELLARWAEIHVRPNTATVALPGYEAEEYLRVVASVHRAFGDIMLPKHRERLKRAIAERLADELIGEVPDLEGVKKIMALHDKYPVFDRDHFVRKVFTTHRDLAVEFYLSSDLVSALRHLGFLLSVFGKEIEELERKYPYERPDLPYPVPFTLRQVVERVLRNVEKEHLEADPALRGYFERLRKFLSNGS